MGHSLSWTAVRGKSPELVLNAFGLRPTTRKWDLPDRGTPYCWATLDDGWVLVLSSPVATFEAAKAAARRSTVEMGSWHHDRFIDESGTADGFSSSLSMGGEVVSCFLMETVMVSRASAWKDGVRSWSVVHDVQAGGIDHLTVEGQPPPSLASMEAAARAKRRAAAPGPQGASAAPSVLRQVFNAFFSLKRRPRLRTYRPGLDTPRPVDYLFDVPVDLAKEVTGFRHDESEREFEVLEPGA
jgi:hypothetical protein